MQSRKIPRPVKPPETPGRLAVSSKPKRTKVPSPYTTEIAIRDLSLSYDGTSQALKQISMDIPQGDVTAFIGPSGCGKSTLLRCFNRLNDLIDGCIISGSITVGGTQILDPNLDATELRKRVGMVFQNQTRSPKQFLRTSPMAHVFSASMTRRPSPRSLKGA